MTRDPIRQTQQQQPVRAQQAAPGQQNRRAQGIDTGAIQPGVSSQGDAQSI